MKDTHEFRVLLVYPNLAMMLIPPLSIALFTRILKNQKYTVDLFDSTHYLSAETSSPENRVKFLQAREFHNEQLGVDVKFDLLGDFRAKVESFQPDFLIFSVVEDSWLQCSRMLASIQDLKIPHIVGGVFPTAAPEVVLNSGLVEFVAIGEGEEVITEAAEAIRTGNDIRELKNICWLNDDGQFIKNPVRPLVDINKVVPDFSLFSESRFFRPMGGRIFKTIPVETYRGCPFSCSFCNSPMHKDFSRNHNLGSFLRRKRMGLLAEELRLYKNMYDPDFFYFVDDSFLARPEKEIYDFCEMYKEFRLPFWFNTRPDHCKLEVLKAIKEVGGYRLSFGIECGNEDFRKRVLRRNVSNQQLIDQFDVIQEGGIAFSINLVIGFPGETRELVMDTVELVRSIRGYDTLTVSIFTPYHGTVLREVAVNNGWLDPSMITQHTTSSSLLRMPKPYLSSTEIDGLARVLPLYCYFPKTEWDALKRAEEFTKEGNRIFEEYAEVYSRNFLQEDQDKPKVWLDHTTGCRSNPKDRFVISPSRIPEEVLASLTI